MSSKIRRTGFVIALAALLGAGTAHAGSGLGFVVRSDGVAVVVRDGHRSDYRHGHGHFRGGRHDYREGFRDGYREGRHDARHSRDHWGRVHGPARDHWGRPHIKPAPNPHWRHHERSTPGHRWQHGGGARVNLR